MLRRSLNVQLDAVTRLYGFGTHSSGVQHAGRHRTPFLTGALRSRFNPVVLQSGQLETIK
jgi:hypothetical protein